MLKKQFKNLAWILLLILVLVTMDSLRQHSRQNAQAVHENQVVGEIPLGRQEPKQPSSVPTTDIEKANFEKLKGIPVLMYHRIGSLPPRPDRIRRDLTVSPANFAKQIAYLKTEGYQSVTTFELSQALKGGFLLPEKPIIITFDDGYQGALENAVPVLLENGMRGVFAIITKYPGLDDYASWQTISEANKMGMEIIPHTQTHIDLKNKKYNHAQRLSEIQDSISDIQSNLGTKPVAFVYPYGNYTDDAQDILRASGIEIAFTTKFGLFSSDSNLLLEPRVRVHGVEDIHKFEVYLHSAVNVLTYTK